MSILETINLSKTYGSKENKVNALNDININIGIMQYLSKCKAKMPIIMVQDILGLDENSRINVPGVESDQNWSWKLINFDDLKERIKDY